MLGTVLDKLSALLSKSFVIASFIPFLAFCVVNGGLLYVHSNGFREAVARYGDSKESISAVLIMIAIGSFLFAMLNTPLREFLEGKYWPEKIKCGFAAGQRKTYERLTGRHDVLQRNRRKLDRVAQRDFEAWVEPLRAARASGPKMAACAYSGDPAAATVADLWRKRARSEWISFEQLERTVRELEGALARYPVIPGDAESKLLDLDHQRLRELMRYAPERNLLELSQVFNERQFRFPKEQVLAPTAMGNVARSIRSYALTRYELNIETFWTRLQKVMQGESFYAVLQDAKLQLDFLVSVFWLLLATWAAWSLVLGFWGYSPAVFAVISVGGPVLLWAVYVLALQNYQAFADLMRSSVDLYRLKLLKELRMPPPTGSLQEARMWETLQNKMEFGKRYNVGYEPPSV